MKIDEHGNITFASGRQLKACAGVIGLSHDIQVHDGFDDSHYWSEAGSPTQFSRADMAELAGHMIERWRRFYQQVNPE